MAQIDNAAALSVTPVQTTADLRHLPIRPWAGLAVLAGWAAAAFLADVLLLRLRDA